MHKSSPRHRHRRRAYILIVVLGLTAIVATLGWAFLDAHSTIMPEAVNRQGANRARYLAESGIDLGMHYLMYPPTTVAACDYWRGDTGIAIDQTADYTNVTVQQDAVDPNMYAITATGVAHDPDNTIRGKHAITAQVIRRPDPRWCIPYALLSSNSLDPPETADFFGDIHANGHIASDGWCRGDVSATEGIWWFGGGPPASTTPFADEVEVPFINQGAYKDYTVSGEIYAAYTAWSYSDIYDWEADDLNAQNWSATNPGRIIHINSDFMLRSNVHLDGTLVVNGKLRIRGAGTSITAVQGYPALVVKDEIEFTNHGDSIDVIGSVICGREIKDKGKIVNMQVTGACILRGAHPVLEVTSIWGTFDFIWDADRSVFWDFTETDNMDPITILSWEEN